MFVNTALTRRVVLAQLKNLRSTRGLNTSSVQGERAVHPGYQKVKELQKIYQVDNGLRVSLWTWSNVDKGLITEIRGIVVLGVGRNQFDIKQCTEIVGTAW